MEETVLLASAVSIFPRRRAGRAPAGARYAADSSVHACGTKRASMDGYGAAEASAVPTSRLGSHQRLPGRQPLMLEPMGPAYKNQWSLLMRAPGAGASTKALRVATWHPHATNLVGMCNPGMSTAPTRGAFEARSPPILVEPLAASESSAVPQWSALRWARVEAPRMQWKAARHSPRAWSHNRTWLKDWSGARPPGRVQGIMSKRPDRSQTVIAWPTLTPVVALLQCAEHRHRTASAGGVHACSMPKKTPPHGKGPPAAMQGPMGASTAVQLLRKQQEAANVERKEKARQQAAACKAQGRAAGLETANQQRKLECNKAAAATVKQAEADKKAAMVREELDVIHTRQRAAADAPTMGTEESMVVLQQILQLDMATTKLIHEQIVGRAMEGLALTFDYRVRKAGNPNSGRHVVLLAEPLANNARHPNTFALQQHLRQELGISEARVHEAGEGVWVGGPQPLCVQTQKGADLVVAPTSYASLRIVLPPVPQTTALIMGSVDSSFFTVGGTTLAYTMATQNDLDSVVELAVDQRELSREAMRLLQHALTAAGLSTTLREGFLLSAIRNGLEALSDPAMTKLSKAIIAVVLDRTRQKRGEDAWRKLWKEAVLASEGAARILLVMENEVAKEELVLAAPNIIITLVGKGAAAEQGGIQVSTAPVRLARKETKNEMAFGIGRDRAVTRVQHGVELILQRPQEFINELAQYAHQADGGGDVSRSFLLALLKTERDRPWPAPQANIYTRWLDTLDEDTIRYSDNMTDEVAALDKNIKASSQEGYSICEIKKHNDYALAKHVVGPRLFGGQDQDTLVCRRLRELIPELQILAASPVLRAGKQRVMWDDSQDALIVAISQQGWLWLEEHWGELVYGNYRVLQMGSGTKVLIRPFSGGKGSDEQVRIKKQLCDFFELGGTLSCPKMAGLDWNTTLTEIDEKYPMDSEQAENAIHDIRRIHAVIGCSRLNTERIMKFLGELCNDGTITAVGESEQGQEVGAMYRYASSALVKIIRTMPHSVDWQMNDDLALQSQIIEVAGSHFLAELSNKLGEGIWDTFDWNTGEVIQQHMEQDDAPVVRSWLWKMQEHPFIFFQNARHAKRMIREALEANVLARIQKSDGWLLVLKNSPFFELLEMATPDQGVRFGQCIDYSRLPYTPDHHEILLPSIVCNVKSAQHVWVWKGTAQVLLDCEMEEQHKATLMPTIRQLLPDELGRHSPLAFRAIEKLQMDARASILDRQDYFLVVLASSPATAPTRTPHFQLKHVYGHKFRAQGAESMSTRNQLKADPECNIAQALQDVARDVFLEVFESALACAPLVLPGWKMRADADTGDAWLQCQEQGLQNLPSHLNLEDQVPHPYLYRPEELETAIKLGKYSVCEVSGGLLVIAPTHALYQHTANTGAFANWNPTDQSLQELTRIVTDEHTTADGQPGPLAGAASADSSTPRGDVEMDTDRRGTTTGNDALNSSPVVVGKIQDGLNPPDDE